MKKINFKKNIEWQKTKFNYKNKIILFLLLIIIILSVIAASLIVYKNYETKNEVKIENYQLYQYFSGIKQNYTGKITIKKNGESVKLESEDVDVDPGFIPIYFQGVNNEVIFPVDMALIFPRIQNKNYKINYFSKLHVDLENEDQNVYLKYEDKDLFLETCFLYDGSDLYFFPYAASVVVDGVVYNLSPLSYVIVNYKELIEIYDKQNDKYTIINNHTNDVIANLGTYKVNLSTDMILYENSSRLLLKQVNLLNTYQGQKWLYFK